MSKIPLNSYHPTTAPFVLVLSEQEKRKEKKVLDAAMGRLC